MQMGWQQAYEWCGAQGMELAKFKTTEELDNIAEVLRERGLGKTKICTLSRSSKSIFLQIRCPSGLLLQTWEDLLVILYGQMDQHLTQKLGQMESQPMSRMGITASI
jgi:hypothetical protein